MLASLRSRLLVLSGLALILLLTLYWLWQQQKPQTLVDAPAHNPQLQCVSYAPYYKPGMNPTLPGMHISAEQIETDLKALSQLTGCVRTYAAAQGLEYVPQAAQKLGMKVILGVWIGWLDAENRAQLDKAVALANQYPETVSSMIVGNEVLLRGEQPEAALRGYLQWAKAHTKIPVTYADVWEFWLKHPGLEQEVDFITVHILPYWEDHPVAVAQGVSHTTAVMDKLAFAFKKPLLIGETGWPSQGRQRFWSKPGVVNQARYVREFLQMAQQRGWKYNIIEAIDQPWKRELEGTVGGYWGVFDTQLQPKFKLQGGVAERSDGVLPYAITLLSALAGWIWAMRLGLSATQRIIASLAAANLGIHAYLQLEYIQFAARYPWETISLGALAVLGWSLVSMQLRHWLGKSECTRLHHAALLLFALALLLTSASLAVDGRYRNFPLILVWLPLLTSMLSVMAASGSAASHRPQRSSWLVVVFTLLASTLAIAVAMPEPGNFTAWWWAATCGLAAAVLPLKAGLNA